jgi:hypothetical protein
VNAILREVELPDFGDPRDRPIVSDDVYVARLRRFRDLLRVHRYDAAIVYADREHSANLAYLSGFDPRFEEAILIVSNSQVPLILVGNECVGLAQVSPLPMRVELHQDLSLPGQPRNRSRSLDEILKSKSITTDMGDGDLVENAGFLLTGCANGLRVINEAEQLAVFEYAAC